MRLSFLAGPALALGAFVLIATPELVREVAAQMPSPPRPGDSRLNQAKPGEATAMPEGAQPEGRDTKGPAKGDGLTTGKDGDKIGATDDDQARHGESHSDPTLAERPAPPSDPQKQ
jgi:hypothetical protein